ncbi:rRNA-processing protein UTP23 homolog isoform X1 [Amphibalanus amphitrite]|uniref:rRNA-processing protein UTP23 homolog isoform X1 n=1 Tax=Amphibalanus amphitrite TaxID=1232801 RepID=UPI001C9027BB|nr:rRNA-processing protein UTP23 homolog isoform X1 [Amphibalanus amphitrite]
MHKVSIKEQIPKILEDNVKILTTPCIVTEVEKMGPALYGAFTIVKQFAHHQCGHTVPVNGAKCVRSMVKGGNKSKYAVATQDQSLRTQLRTMPGVPILYLHNSAPTLEKPPEVSTDRADRWDADRVGLSKEQRKTITSLKRSILGESEPVKRRKKKVVKGANPLSRRRRKERESGEQQAEDGGEAERRSRRRRRRVKLAAHVKEELARRRQMGEQAV